MKGVEFMSNIKKTGALVAHVLKNEGVKCIFGIPGGHIYPTIEEAEKLGMRFISTRHEMSAAFAAEGWALTTGTLGVCTGTAGPGVTNLLTGMANAYMGKYPVFYLGGRARVTEFDRNELQDFDQLSLVRSMSKYAKTVYEPDRVPEYVAQAIAEAVNGTPGPAYIEVPRDLNDSTVDMDAIKMPAHSCKQGRMPAADEDIKRAAQLIQQAERPLIIAGSGLWWSQAQAELQAFVEKTDIPFCTRNAARGAISDKHTNYVSIGCNDPITINVAQHSDLVIIIGTRASYTLSRSVIRPETKMIRIDIDPAELNNQWQPDVGIVGDAKMVLAQLTDAAPEMEHAMWKQLVQQIKMQAAQGMSQLCPDPLASPINPIAFFEQLRQEIDENTIVVFDGGDVATWAAMLLPAYGPGQLLGIANNAFGPLGVGMGYAMAAKLAHPEKEVILLTGDGAMGYNIMEFDTCMRYGIKLTAIVFNDSMWGMIKRSESRKAPETKNFPGLDLREETHYERVVEGLGGHGAYVTDIRAFRAAIQEAKASDKPACINVVVDPKIGPPAAGC